jgi:hypothetical protein
MSDNRSYVLDLRLPPKRQPLRSGVEGDVRGHRRLDAELPVEPPHGSDTAKITPTNFIAGVTFAARRSGTCAAAKTASAITIPAIIAPPRPACVAAVACESSHTGTFPPPGANGKDLWTPRGVSDNKHYIKLFAL